MVKCMLDSVGEWEDFEFIRSRDRWVIFRLGQGRL